jgi:hypothetical protein
MMHKAGIIPLSQKQNMLNVCLCLTKLLLILTTCYKNQEVIGLWHYLVLLELTPIKLLKDADKSICILFT